MWENKEDMKVQTKEHLEKMPMARMKHFDGQGALASLQDDIYRLVVDGTKTAIIFKSIDELSDAGWTID